MFRHFRKKKGPEARACPLCELENPPDAISCSQCYFQFEKNARQQDEAISGEEEGTLLDELLNAELEVDEDETTPVDVITMEDMTVEVDQYEVVEQEEESEDFTFIQSTGPTFAEIEVEGDGPIESQITPSLASMPGMEVEQNTEFMGELADEIDVDEHETDVDLLNLPSLPVVEPPPPIERSEEDFPHASNNEEQEVALPEIPEVEEAEEDILPPLPDYPGEESNLEVAVESDEEPTEPPAVEVAPHTPKSAPPADAFTSQSNGHIWPWPSDGEWDYRDLYRELKEAMEAAQRGDHESAAKSLDYLGPHLGERIDLIYYVGQVLQIIGRQESLSNMLLSAQKFYPEDQNVSSAVYHLTVTGSDNAGHT